MIDHTARLNEIAEGAHGFAYFSVLSAVQDAMPSESIWKDLDTNLFYAKKIRPEGANWVLLRPPTS